MNRARYMPDMTFMQLRKQYFVYFCLRQAALVASVVASYIATSLL